MFDPMLPDNPALWAVFGGQYAGCALVNDPRHPSQCVLRTDAALTFASRQVEPRFLADAIAYFRHTGEVWLVWPPDAPYQPDVPADSGINHRLEFYDCDPASPVLAGLRQSLPAGYEIRPIDRQLLGRCEWRSDMEFYCGSLDSFLAYGAGLCLMKGDEIIVEAYVSSFGYTRAEIGAITHAPYRGHGFAPVACAYLIQLCAQRGFAAYWSCDTDNTASARVAQKLGFRQERAYRIFEYSADGGDFLQTGPKTLIRTGLSIDPKELTHE